MGPDPREEAHTEARLRSVRAAAVALVRHASFTTKLTRDLLEGAHTEAQIAYVSKEADADFALVEQRLGAFPIHELEHQLAVEVFARAQMTATGVRAFLAKMGSRSERNRIENPARYMQQCMDAFAKGFALSEGILAHVRDGVTEFTGDEQVWLRDTFAPFE